MDRFARESAAHAHKRITELVRDIRRLDRAISRRSEFSNRCHLCGSPCGPEHHYCHEHSWAAGKP
jgi:hypothetical protein